MAVNLTPQYFEADEAYKKAKTPEERLECLRKMWILVPKHKASEKLQAELKTKLSVARDDVEKEAAKPKKGGATGITRIPRQGAGQILLLGAPNVGKSRILTRLTRATPEVAPYPFTTREPSAGMMDWKDVRVQLIDTPPITVDMLDPVVSSMSRSCDAVALVIAESGKEIETIRDVLYQALGVIRVYTKRQGKPPDMENPYTLPRGSSITELARAIHRDMADTLKSAKLWGNGVSDGQLVPRDHELHDGDIAELQAG